MTQTNKHKPWTPEEAQALIELREKGLTDKQIARKIGRTKYSVQKQRSRMHIEQGIDEAVNYKRTVKTVEIKPPADYQVINVPVTEMENPQLELMESDSIANNVVDVIKPILNASLASSQNVAAQLGKWQNEYISALGNNRGDFITVKEDVADIKKRLNESTDKVNASIDNLNGWVFTLVLSNTFLAGLVAWTLLS